MSTPGVLPPLSSLRIKNCLEDQGLAISSMLATPGEASVACGSRELGSGAGVGTSICGWSATRGSVCLGRSEEHTSELQSRLHLVCRLLLEKNTISDWHIEETSRVVYH